jgi:hypothetical protein
VADILAWLEASALGHAMRGAGVWSYAILNLCHILGIATLFGSVLIIDLRLMGLWRRIPLQHLTKPFAPVSAGGFVLAALSGLCMISTNATEYIGNPFLLIKFPAIGIALINVGVLTRLDAWREQGEQTTSQRRQLAIAGGVSLASWLTAIGAGRMIGYW